MARVFSDSNSGRLVSYRVLRERRIGTGRQYQCRWQNEYGMSHFARAFANRDQINARNVGIWHCLSLKSLPFEHSELASHHNAEQRVNCSDYE